MARDIFTVNISCKKCKTSGTAKWSQPQHSLESTLLEVSAGFLPGPDNDKSGDQKILCESCGTAV